jgi:DNA-binding transcriptional MocR family regulator
MSSITSYNRNHSVELSTQDVKRLGDEQFLGSMVPSFISMDTAGLLIRMDSFPKTLAPGSRSALIIAQMPVIERLQRHSK